MEILIWIGIPLIAILLVALDLGCFERRHKILGPALSLAWSLFWMVLGVSFTALIYHLFEKDWAVIGYERVHAMDGATACRQYLGAFLALKSITLDQLFFTALILKFFETPLEGQHRILRWGILSAPVSRLMMVPAGILTLRNVPWFAPVLGILLILTAIKVLFFRHDNQHPRNNLFIRLCHHALPLSSEYEGDRFFAAGKKPHTVTPLFEVLIIVLTASFIFSIDAIPAGQAFAEDPLILWSANLFSLLGMRSLYFAVAATMRHLRPAKLGLALILGYLGGLMLTRSWIEIPVGWSLVIVATLLAGALIASGLMDPGEVPVLVSPLEEELDEWAVVTVKQARRIVILILGSSIMLVGGVMIFTPGPALVVIPTGLAILSTEFVWARRWLRSFKAGTRLLRQKFFPRRHPKP